MNLMTNLLIVGTKEGVLFAEHEGDAWRQLRRGLTARQVNSLSVQGGIILAGTTEGMFRSHDLGQTWRMASEGLSVPKIRWVAHHPSASGTVLAGTEPAAIFLSRDGGQRWRECPEVAALRDEYAWYLPYSPEAGCVRGFAFHGKRVYAAVEQGGLLRSDDAGETWRLAEGSDGIPRTPPEGFIHPDVHSVVVHSSSPDLVFAPTGAGLYGSRDGGASWKHLYRCYCRAVWSDPADAKHLIFGPAASVDQNGRIEVTNDGGETWQPAAKGLEVPWPEHMVERFFQMDYELLAVLSNGELVAASLPTLQWGRILPDAGWVRAVAAMRM
jgi:photosystem II stability/assembly factor-like uncharacterized protein